VTEGDTQKKKVAVTQKERRKWNSHTNVLNDERYKEKGENQWVGTPCLLPYPTKRGKEINTE